MGEVYRARDERLKRDVAIKVLPASFSAETDRLRRFEQEAQAAGSLNHPNITAVYDVGTHEGAPYLVQELLEGETLSSALAGSRLAPRRAIDYALQIAHGLAAAHEKGIVHRDLKPENLFVTKGGRVKILDFGLAKLTHAEERSGQQTNLPTAAGTEPGVVMGTLGYMAPEQVKGTPADARSDIFAFGAILYEMLSGRRAFSADSAAETMSAILREDPPALSATNQQVPPGLDRIIRHCLEKSPDRRFHSAHDVALALEALPDSAVGLPAPAAPSASSRRTLLLTAAAALLLLLGAAIGTLLSKRALAPPSSLRLSVLPPEEVSLSNIGREAAPFLSPDGKQIAFLASDARGGGSLWIRSLADARPRRLEAGEIGGSICWSPDSRYLAFAGRGESSTLKTISASGGPPSTVASLADHLGGACSWSRTGEILLSVSGHLLLFRQAGSALAPLTPADGASADALRLYPEFLPDGRHFLYYLPWGAAEKNCIYVASLDGGKAKRLLSTVDSQAVYAEPGYLLFLRVTTLFSQPFDAKRQELSGEPTPVAEGLAPAGLALRGSFSAAGPSMLAYLAAQPALTQLAWFDRQGRPLGTVAVPEGSQSPEISPDGKRVLVELRDASGSRDLWMANLARGTASRFTFDPADDSDPVWSPDGLRVVFQSSRGGKSALYVKSSESEGPEEKFADWPEGRIAFPSSWSRDGRFLLFNSGGLWSLPLTGDRRPTMFTAASVSGAGQFSPDGRWVAYQSDESGQFQIYVRAFPSGGKWQVSTDGGFKPRWRQDGRELYYISPDRKLMVVSIEPGTEFRASSPRELFQTRIAGPLVWGIRFNYAVEPPDGKRFLIVTDTGQARPASFTVVTNWQQNLKR